MRVLTLVHRWLGILFCLLFAMWFASGIVMHFVPFPALTEAERIAGLALIEGSPGLRSPAEAAGMVEGAARVRLLQRVDRPVYLVSSGFGIKALGADDLSDAAVRSKNLALAIATDHARRRKIDVTQTASAELTAIDQWTVSGAFNRHRPLYRIALNDVGGTELYVSSSTGEVVGDTTRRERGWNYIGSVAHWIYPIVLRSRAGIWNIMVWSLSLAALIAALAGNLLGILKIKPGSGTGMSPYVDWHKWHHLLGLACMVFVVSWIFSGWLSMDSGRLFSTGAPSSGETAKLAGVPAWNELSKAEWRRSAAAKEIDWFPFNGKLYRRERTGLDTQRLVALGATARALQAFLEADEVSAAVGRIAARCKAPSIIAADDSYVIPSSTLDAPVYRSVCGGVWYHVDGASGALLERSDRSSRAYRWLYNALHTMDIPALKAHPTLRSALIVILCGLGFLFSLTGVVIGWRRLRQQFSAPAANGG
ncbi:MAG: PepSY domain-containing protein [Bradyrhizobium sp.]